MYSLTTLGVALEYVKQKCIRGARNLTNKNILGKMGQMTRREWLMATLKGEVVDRPAVNFYEIGGFLVNPNDPDEYNIYNSPSWQPLLNLAENHTDIIRMVSPVRAQSHLSWAGSSAVDIRKQFVVEKVWE